MVWTAKEGMMIDISKFVTVNEEGQPVIDKDAYQSAYDADLRKSLDSNSKNTREKLEAEIRKQVEEEAKLSAEEKLSKAMKDFETEMAQKRKDFAQSQAKTKMKSAGLDDEEIGTYLELVSDEESLAKIDKILDIRNKRTESLKKEWEQSIMANQPNPQSSATATNDSLGATMARKYQHKTDDGTPKVTAFGS